MYSRCSLFVTSKCQPVSIVNVHKTSRFSYCLHNAKYFISMGTGGYMLIFLCGIQRKKSIKNGQKNYHLIIDKSPFGHF